MTLNIVNGYIYIEILLTQITSSRYVVVGEFCITGGPVFSLHRILYFEPRLQYDCNSFRRSYMDPGFRTRYGQWIMSKKRLNWIIFRVRSRIIEMLLRLKRIYVHLFRCLIHKVVQFCVINFVLEFLYRYITIREK